MKKIILLFIIVILSMPLFAQLEVKEGSFKEVVGFVNINTERMYDDNDRAYSVVKVKTENINDKERRRLLFEGDARTFFELEYKPGEVWVYISYYASYMKISHPDFGSTEFTFPFDMVGKKGYELTLINKPSVDQEFADRLAKLEGALAGGTVSDASGYLVIKTTPVDGAMVIIDGQEMEMKTPCVSDKLGVGPHRVRVEKEFYKPYVTVVAIENGRTKNLDIELQKEIGSLEIVTQPTNVNIKMGLENKGTTPKVFNNMPAGNYKVELSKKKYETVVEEVTIKDGETTHIEIIMDEDSNLKSLRKKGWVFRPEIGAGIIDNATIININQKSWAFNTQDCFTISTNTGYCFNPYIYLGAGVGLLMTDMFSCMSIPVYINPRFYVSDRKTGLYFDLRLGLSVSVKSSNGKLFYPQDDSNESKINGLTGSFEIGIEHKRSNFGITLSEQHIILMTEIKDYTETNDGFYYSIMLKYGYNIFVK